MKFYLPYWIQSRGVTINFEREKLILKNTACKGMTFRHTQILQVSSHNSTFLDAPVYLSSSSLFSARKHMTKPFPAVVL